MILMDQTQATKLIVGIRGIKVLALRRVNTMTDFFKTST